MLQKLLWNLALYCEDIIKGTNVVSKMKRFMAINKLDYTQLNGYQTARFERLVQYAYKNVPHYRRAFDICGFNPTSRQSIIDDASMPILTRDDFHTGIERNLLSKEYDMNGLSVGWSGGSSNSPIKFYKDSSAISSGIAAGILGWRVSGWNPGDRTLVIWGNPRSIKKWKKPSSKIKALLMNTCRFPASSLTETSGMQHLCRYIEKVKPKYISGYTRAIYLLARYCDKNRIELPNCIRGVLTTAETLLPQYRSAIAETLGPVYDCYGSGEVNGLAYQCSHGTYHIMDFHVLIQFQDDPETGMKRLLVTDLDNYAMPLIRYQIGDLAIPSSKHVCQCGREGNQLTRVVGRISDIISTNNGGYILTPSFLGSKFMRELKGVDQYQIIQLRHDTIQLRLVTNSEYCSETLLSLRRYLEGNYGEYFSFDIVDDMPLIVSESGKIKLAISLADHKLRSHVNQ